MIILWGACWGFCSQYNTLNYIHINKADRNLDNLIRRQINCVYPGIGMDYGSGDLMVVWCHLNCIKVNDSTH